MINPPSHSAHYLCHLQEYSCTQGTRKPWHNIKKLQKTPTVSTYIVKSAKYGSGSQTRGGGSHVRGGDLKSEVGERRSRGIPLNLTPVGELITEPVAQSIFILLMLLPDVA